MRVVLSLLLVISLVLGGLGLHHRMIKSSDSYLRDHIVKLTNEAGASCTGVEIRTPKHAVYTLTAGHCRALLDSAGQMIAIDEQGNKQVVTLIVEDNNSDLLLLSGITTTGIEIASSTSSHQLVKAITHGHGLAAYRTDGELIQEQTVLFMEEVIANAEDLASCMARSPKTMVLPNFLEGTIMCAVSTDEVVATAAILPGSSGGPLFALDGKLVGIASAASPNDSFGRFVRLQDIQAFLKDM